MIDPYDRLKEAYRQRHMADMEVEKACREIEKSQEAFKNALEVKGDCPCSVAVLPNGKIAVHIVYQSGEYKIDDLCIVEPDFLDDKGRRRGKFANERLGSR